MDKPNFVNLLKVLGSKMYCQWSTDSSPRWAYAEVVSVEQEGNDTRVGLVYHDMPEEGEYEYYLNDLWQNYVDGELLINHTELGQGVASEIAPIKALEPIVTVSTTERDYDTEVRHAKLLLQGEELRLEQIKEAQRLLIQDGSYWSLGLDNVSDKYPVADLDV
ncbi:hypothetical protein [Vibrio phage VCPH]|nr:hypothetical protein [Vibrio phage VCPH]